MKVIGLTGNIASGKTTVLRMLRDLGAQVIDTDEEVHGLMRPGGRLLKFIVHRFGKGVLTPEGGVNRVRLGQIAFSDPCALAYLEGLLHPAVYQEVEGWIARLEAEVSGSGKEQVYVVDGVKVQPQLLPRCDSFWVVYCRPEQQMERLLTYRRMDKEEAQRRLSAQVPWEERLRQADVVIDNSGTFQETEGQVKRGWEKLMHLTDRPSHV